jgi:hypothetical protein
MVRLFVAKSSWLLSLAIFSLCMRDAKLVPNRFLKWGKDRFLEGKKIRKIESARRPRVPQRFLRVPEMGKQTAKTGSQSHTLQRKSVLSSVTVRQLCDPDGAEQLPTTERSGSSYIAIWFPLSSDGSFITESVIQQSR